MSLELICQFLHQIDLFSPILAMIFLFQYSVHNECKGDLKAPFTKAVLGDLRDITPINIPTKAFCLPMFFFLFICSETCFYMFGCTFACLE